MFVRTIQYYSLVFCYWLVASFYNLKCWIIKSFFIRSNFVLILYCIKLFFLLVANIFLAFLLLIADDGVFFLLVGYAAAFILFPNSFLDRWALIGVCNFVAAWFLTILFIGFLTTFFETLSTTASKVAFLWHK